MTPEEASKETLEVIRAHVKRMQEISERERQCTEALAIVNTRLVYQIGACHVAKMGRETLKEVLDDNMDHVVESMRTT